MEITGNTIQQLAAQLIPYLLAALSPVLVGFLRQLSAKVDSAPWYLKSILNFLIGGAITYLSNLAGADASVAAGAMLAGAGSLNIAARKGLMAA